jgi:hypothetical protein
VQTRDLSFGGIGFLQTSARGEPRREDRFMVKLPRAKCSVLLLCKTTFCRKLVDDLYMVGAEFQGVLESEREPRCMGSIGGEAKMGGEEAAAGQGHAELGAIKAVEGEIVTIGDGDCVRSVKKAVSSRP